MSDEDAVDDASGPQLARAALEAARAGSAPVRRRKNAQTRHTPESSMPTSDDPMPLKSVVAALLRSRQWQKPIAEGRVFGGWPKIVGPDIAAHATPTRLYEGELSIRVDSPAWATQLRLLSKTILAKITRYVGAGVVRKLKIYSS